MTPPMYPGLAAGLRPGPVSKLVVAVSEVGTVGAERMKLKDEVQLTPWQKWAKHRKFPWKLAVHTLLVLCST